MARLRGTRRPCRSDAFGATATKPLIAPAHHAAMRDAIAMLERAYRGDAASHGCRVRRHRRPNGGPQSGRLARRDAIAAVHPGVWDLLPA